MRTATEELDAALFESLRAQSRDAWQNRDFAESARLAGEALGLWRGPAYDMADPPEAVRLEAGRLVKLQLATLELRIEADLALGRHEHLLEELITLSAEHPLRERFRAQLILALYRSGRAADALEAYREAREMLADQLGLEPGEELQQLEIAVRQGDPILDAPTMKEDGGTPAELPPDSAVFTGREAELEEFGDLLIAEVGTTPRLVAIAGPGGAGKSTLAIRVAHLVRERFPDGQLYVNLHGATPDLAPLNSLDVLARFLRSLGSRAPGTDLGESSAAFRTACDGRRMLIVLDDAHDAGQVRPLLPGTPTCAVLITSRRVLSGLDGTRHHTIEGLTTDESVRLLGRIVGHERLQVDASAVGQIVELCGRLPLSLSIAGARLAARPGWSVRTIADRLACEDRRLSELASGDRAVSASIAISYASLRTPAARLFRLLGTLKMQDFGVATSAALADCALQDADQLLDELSTCQLLTSRSADRYQMHDLVRLYSKSLAEQENPVVLNDAVRRVAHHYLATAYTGLPLAVREPSDYVADLGPLSAAGESFADLWDLHAWLESERSNLAAITTQAISIDADGPLIAAALSRAFKALVERQGLHADRVAITEAGLAGAQVSGHPEVEARAHIDVAAAYTLVRDSDGAELHLRRALELLPDEGAGRLVAKANLSLGLVNRHRGRTEASRVCLETALDIYLRIGHTEGQAAAYNSIGLTYGVEGRYAEATSNLLKAVGIAREHGEQQELARALGNAADCMRAGGNPRGAIPLFEEAIELCEQNNDHYVRASCLWDLGNAYRDVGDQERGRMNWRESAAILHRLDLISADDVDTIRRSPNPAPPSVIAY